MAGFRPPRMSEFCNSKLNSSISSFEISSHKTRSETSEIGGAPVRIKSKDAVRKQVSVSVSSILTKIVSVLVDKV